MTKVVVPKDFGYLKKAESLLPLIEDLELYKLDKTNSVSWELSTQPGTAGAPTYKYQVRVLTGTETARQMLRWRLDVIKVCTGLNVTTLATKRPIMEACMRPGPLSNFNAAVEASAQVRYNAALETAYATDQVDGNAIASGRVIARGAGYYLHVDDLQQSLGLTVTNLLPRKILARVKRSLRRDMRKPADMKVRNFYQAILRLNNEEIPNLPPYGINQRLSQDELLDIVLFGTPKSWQNEMDRQGFDPMEKHLHEVIDFMEKHREC